MADGWLFRYVEDPSDDLSRTLSRPPPLRPTVPVRLIDKYESPHFAALIDSGSERTLASPTIARSIGVDLRDAPEGTVGVGGKTRTVRFATVNIEIYADLLNEDTRALDSWEAEVGFISSWEPPWAIVLGGIGFFDRFTVTLHRAAAALVVENQGRFDDRFGPLYETVDNRQPRFRP